MKKKARLIIVLLCAIVQGAWAQNEEIQYIDYLWNAFSQTLSPFESKTSDYTGITNGGIGTIEKNMTICRVFRKKVVTLQAESLRW